MYKYIKHNTYSNSYCDQMDLSFCRKTDDSGEVEPSKHDVDFNKKVKVCDDVPSTLEL